MPSPAPPTTSWGRWAPTYIRPYPVIAGDREQQWAGPPGHRFAADEGEGGRDSHVPRDPTQVARDPFANAHVAEHCLGTGPSCERFRRLRTQPGGGPRSEERSRQASATRQERHRGDGGDRRERPRLHDDPDGNADPVVGPIHATEDPLLVHGKPPTLRLHEAAEEQSSTDSESEGATRAREHPHRHEVRQTCTR